MDTANTKKVGSDKAPEGTPKPNTKDAVPKAVPTKKVGSDKVPEGTPKPNTKDDVPKAVPKVGAGKKAAEEGAAGQSAKDDVPKAVPKVGAGKKAAEEGAAGQSAASIHNYVPFHSEDFYEALKNVGRTTTVDDCWSIFTGLNSETGSPLSYEEFERMVRRER